MSRYMWRAHFQNALSANSKIDVAKPMPSSEIMFWKRALPKRAAYIYMHMWKVLYQNTIFEVDIGITSSVSGIALNAFWKELFIYIYVGCWSLVSWQHLRSYQDGDWLVIMYTRDNVIVPLGDQVVSAMTWCRQSHYLCWLVTWVI